ncbi:hypothetical protein AKJ09_08990 [Labilithrix luteola]|uniref:Uncharacterized protein n=1 Tax=Labilithrix luteola TaxID=1391654 RepID=A0A0K1Q9J1_9BACT|nr:helix-turn-helix transcriptional regulator [Labilithrix luteola]AKV02327.1 hypothetical protein AKJ09_08990 [Labilithrix luteola]
MGKDTSSVEFSSEGQRLLVAAILRERIGPSRGSQLLHGKGSAAEVAERLGVGKTYAHYLMTGERVPTIERAEEIAAEFAIAPWTWTEEPWTRDSSGKWGPPDPLDDDQGDEPEVAVLPADGSLLSPWLLRLIRDGVTGIDHDDDETERTASVIAATLVAHPAMLGDVLAALAKYA